MHIQPIAAFEDNYIWLLHANGYAAVIDPGDAAPVQAYLAAHQLELVAILLTHHHHDHIGGVEVLRQRHACRVHGPKMSELSTETLAEGEIIDLNAYGLGAWRVMLTPGHTLDHCAYVSAEAPPRLFCGDTLFAAGCGRLFEGTAEQMQASLQKIRDLPDDTLVYCGHEYTQDNLRFAHLAEPDNAAIASRIAQVNAQRARSEPSVPSLLGEEKATNPFLRWDQQALLNRAQQHCAHVLDTPAAVFACVRACKDAFDRQST